MSNLLHSRKFWLAVFGVIQAVIMHYLNVPEEIWQSIVLLVSVLIAGIAVEDAGLKAGLVASGSERIINVKDLPDLAKPEEQ